MSQPTPMPPERLVALADAYLLGELSTDQFAELEQELKRSPASRALFATVTDQATAMREVFGNVTDQLVEVDDDQSDDFFSILSALDTAEETGPVDMTEEITRRELEAKERERERRRALELARNAGSNDQKHTLVIPKPIAWLGLAALVGLAAGLAVYFGQTTVNPNPSTPGGAAQSPRDDMPTVTNVAFVRSAVDARWSGQPIAEHGYLRSNTTVTLSEGLVEVVFGDGVAVIVQGPATFEPTGPDAMRLVSGRITATVPEAASRFTINTPGGLTIDHGTEFGVIANADGQVLAQAFIGGINLTPVGGEQVQLAAGEAMIANSRGGLRTAEPDELAFVRNEEFTARQDSEGSRQARWLAYTYELRRDPSLVALYTFTGNNTLANHAPGAGSTLAGSWEGRGQRPTRTAGRWPGEQAVSFAAAREDRIIVPDWPSHAPDRAITVSVWFRADPLREDWNVVVSQWGGFLGTECRFHLGVLGQASDGNAPSADRRVCLHVWSDGRQRLKDQARSGGSIVGEAGWVHAVFTITARGEVKLYINGQEVDHMRLAYDEATLDGSQLPLVLGGKAAGNLFFDGAIDELLILERAMSPDEIAVQFEVGNPTPGGP